MRRPSSVSPDEVHITREEHTALIEHADRSTPTTHLTLGPRISEMSDEEILAEYNLVLAHHAEAIDSHDNVCREVPLGRPQITWDERCQHWVALSDVLRCVIEDGGPEDSRVTLRIDDRELTLAEFGRLLETHAGWGMRITFVPEEYLADPPEIEIEG